MAYDSNVDSTELLTLNKEKIESYQLIKKYAPSSAKVKGIHLEPQNEMII